MYIFNKNSVMKVDCGSTKETFSTSLVIKMFFKQRENVSCLDVPTGQTVKLEHYVNTILLSNFYVQPNSYCLLVYLHFTYFTISCIVLELKYDFF